MPSLAAAPPAEPDPAELAADYNGWLAATGRGSRSYADAARRFLQRWPTPQAWAGQPLAARLAADSLTRPFLTFLMLHVHLQPGYDWLAHRKITYLLRYAAASPLAEDVAGYTDAAGQVGYGAHIAKRSADRVILRLLIQTGRPLHGLLPADLHALENAFRARAAATDRDWRNDRGLLHAAHAVLYHLGILDETAPNRRRRVHDGHGHHFTDSPPQLQATFTAYLQRLVGTHALSTVQGIGIRLGHFGRHLSATDPAIGALTELDRVRHVEPYLNAVATAISANTGQPISVGEQRNRVFTLGRFLADITEWGWPQAPARTLVFSRDVPRQPRPLPRYLPPDADRRLAAALEASPNRLFADALLLARATGLRIGELVDLELDCVHEVPGAGSWLKVPLGKLDSERMVPLDEDTLALVDQLVAARSSGEPLPHPRSGRRVQFLLTTQGKRISTQALNRPGFSGGS